MRSYRTIFFDLDHTLWDFEANSRATLDHIYREFDLGQKGIAAFEEFYQIYKAHNERLWERYRKGFIKRDELKWKRMWLTLLDFKVADEPFAKELAQVFIEMLPRQQKLFPHAVSVLDHCRSRGYQLSVITNGFEDTQWKKLEACQIGHYFAHVVTSEKSHSVKPNAEIFEFALQASNTTSEQALMIGDNLDVDIAGAKNAGIDQVFFNPEKRAHDFVPTFEIACLSELQQIL